MPYSGLGNARRETAADHDAINVVLVFSFRLIGLVQLQALSNCNGMKNQIDFSHESGICSLRVERSDAIIGNVNKAFRETKNVVFLAP